MADASDGKTSEWSDGYENGVPQTLGASPPINNAAKVSRDNPAADKNNAKWSCLLTIGRELWDLDKLLK